MTGKGIRTGSKTTIVKVNVEHSDVIKDGDLLPGDCVSTDQFECRVKGRLPGSRGKEDPTKIYSGGTVFVDHASSTIIIYDQVSLGASDTIRSKDLYEVWTAENGVSVKS